MGNGLIVGGFLNRGSTGVSSFSPTIYGRQAAVNYVVYAFGDTETIDFPAGAGSGCDIVLYATASDIELRVSAAATGNVAVDEEWYDTSGTPGDAGSGYVTIFKLNERTDVTVNIYTSNQTVGFGDGVTFSDQGTWTDDDKSTFFNPTNATNYGSTVDCDSSQTVPGSDADQGYFTLQFTFRKTGYNDYTISFQAFAQSQCTYDSI